MATVPWFDEKIHTALQIMIPIVGRPLHTTPKYPKPELCHICNLPADLKNRFEWAHLISYKNGFDFLGLTMVFLNSRENLVMAHRLKCNKSAELNPQQSIRRLWDLGHRDLPKHLHLVYSKHGWPFLPDAVLNCV